MPELPEVENVARSLRLNLLGRRLTGLRVRFAGVLADPTRRVRTALLGKGLQQVRRHGKYLLLRFGDYPAAVAPGSLAPSLVAEPRQPLAATEDTHLMIHLRMTGQIFILDGYRPDKHVHLTLDFDGLPVHYRDIRKFGRFTLVENSERPAALAHIGPDMLNVRFAEWSGRIAGRKAPLKSLLLDQGIAAGLGNIYADEALFRAGIHPTTPPADLDTAELKNLLRSARSILRMAIRHGGTTFLNFTNFNGKPGNFRERLEVYGRTGKPCRTCRTDIERIVLGGRSTHFCPHCQE